MATRRIVPRGDGEGGLGASAKRWGPSYFTEIHADNIGDIVPDATVDVKGIAQLATPGEVNAGTDTQKTITPQGLHQRQSTINMRGLVELATDAEVIAGTDTERAVTPSGNAAVFNARIADDATVLAGTSNNTIVSPGGLQSKIADNATTLAGASTNTVVSPAGLNAHTAARPSGFKNAIINGEPNIWQRGTSFSATTASQFLADRWRNYMVGTTQAVSRQEFPLGQTDVPGEPRFFHRSVVASVAGAGNQAHLQQRIEGVRTFAGQTVTLSFWAKADAGKDIAFLIQQNFGTGGTPSDSVFVLVEKITLTTSWQKITKTIAMPSIAGKTLGTGGNDSLTVAFFFDAGSDYNDDTDSLGHQSGTFDIAQVQLEAGSIATPFEQRPVGAELQLCQRYYLTIPNAFRYRYRSAANAITVVRLGVVSFPEMRAIPTGTLTGISTTNVSGNPTIDILNAKVVGIVWDEDAANATTVITASFTADAEL